MRAGNGHPRTNRSRPAWATHAGDAGQPAEPEVGWYERGVDGMVLRLCLLRRASEVMLAVIDASDDAPTPRQPDWVRESGRGLQIIDALSSVWGWSPIDGHGKAVWAVLPYDLGDRSGRRPSRTGQSLREAPRVEKAPWLRRAQWRGQAARPRAS